MANRVNDGLLCRSQSPTCNCRCMLRADHKGKCKQFSCSSWGFHRWKFEDAVEPRVHRRVVTGCCRKGFHTLDGINLVCIDCHKPAKLEDGVVYEY